MSRLTSLSVKCTNDRLQNARFEIYKTWLLSLLRCNPSPLADSMHMLLRADRYQELYEAADVAVSQSYDTAQSHFEAHQIAALIRKYPWSLDQVKLDPEQTALDSFIRSESRCKEINSLLRQGCGLPRQNTMLNRMASWIRYVLGDEPDIVRICELMQFTSGASIGATGTSTHLAKKLGAYEWTCGPGCYVYAYWGIQNDPHLRLLLSEVNGGVACLDVDAQKLEYRSRALLVNNNKIAFVPKTAKTHRVIAVEPMLSSFVQKGIDLHMREKLRRVGLDLTDQSRNQRMARNGSLAGNLGFATIDLSAASDSVSIELCKALLPPAWFELLNTTRSTNYKLPNNEEVFRYEKFCNMGNGFCFPLETLIFAAAAVASGNSEVASESTWSIYGDDIIVPNDTAATLIDLLDSCGFSTNNNKTFIVGPFRESCGSDWYNGSDVRPFTLDFELDSLSSLHKCLNLSRRNERTKLFFQESRSVLTDAIGRDHQLFRPFTGTVDSGIDSTGDEHLYCDNVRFDSKTRNFKWRELVSKAVEDSNPHPVRYRSESIDMYAILLGASPSSRRRGCPVQYTLRRETHERLTVVSHPGATSLWTPPARSL